MEVEDGKQGGGLAAIVGGLRGCGEEEGSGMWGAVV